MHINFDFDFNFSKTQKLNNLYKSSSMKEIFAILNKFIYENSIFYIYGDRGTEKEYIASFIINKISNPNVINFSQGLDIKSLKKENFIFIITDIEKTDISFLKEKQIIFKCAIIISNFDYEMLYKINKISHEKYEILKNATKLYLPPLKERKQDIIPLANMLLHEIAKFLCVPLKELSKEAKDAIIEYPWPENFSQLKQCLTKAYLMTKNQKLKTKDIFGDYDDKFSIKNFLESKLGNILGDLCHLDNSNLYDTIIQEVEKALFILVLNETGNNQVKTARILGINRNTLSKKLKNYNLI